MNEASQKIETILQRGDSVVLAISGGPDSMALLHFIHQFHKEKKLQLICAHVNHKLRIESEEEKVLVENYCKKNNIIFEYMEILKYGKENFHEDARNKRYQFFEQLIQKYHAKYLLTAHHGDDLIETILMRILRGSSINGYAGFKEITDRENYQIIRPFIRLGKEDLKNYCIQNDIPYAEDLSNEKDVYTRNRIRKYVVPYMKKETPKFYEKINDYALELQEHHQYVYNIALEKKNRYYDKGILKSIDLFKEEDTVIQKKVLFLILEELYREKICFIQKCHIESILQMLYDKKPNVQISLPNHIIVRKSYDKLLFDEEEEKKCDYQYEIKNCVLLPNGKRIEKVEDIDYNNNFVCRLSSKDITLPLYVRNKQEGDFMTIKNFQGQKKLKAIFIENKVDLRERCNYPVVVDAKNQIVWLPGLKKSHFDKQTSENCDIILRYY